MHLVKRVLPLILVIAIMATVLSPAASAVSDSKAKRVYRPKGSYTQLHPFTSTEDLIRDAVEEMRKKGMTQKEEEDDKPIPENAG